MGSDQQPSKHKPVQASHGQPLARQPVTAESVSPALSPGLAGQPDNARSSQRASFVLRLQRTYGNQAVQNYLRLLPAPHAPAVSQPARVQRDPPKGGATAEPAPAVPEKKFLDQAAAQEALSKAFGDLKKIDAGKVSVLKQAAFQAAYDKIYGATKYSWDKYIKPGAGNLEGFAYENVNYINEDCISYDTVPHEMLHNNTASDWTAVVGSEFNEGTTEHLTIAAMAKLGKTPSHSYPDQESCVQAVVAAGVSEDSLKTAYLKGGAQTLVADVITAKCKHSWTDFKTAMQAKNFATAKALLVLK